MAIQNPIINALAEAARETNQGNNAAALASLDPAPAPTNQSLPNGGASFDTSIIYLSLLNHQFRHRSAPEVNPASVAALASAPTIDRPTQIESTVTAAPPSRRRKPNFAEKLHSMLSSQEYRHVVTWLPSGRSFCIMDQEEFARRILPRHFREAKFESFSRRLKRWGFKKDYANTTAGQSSSQTIVVSHDLFLRDRPDLCMMMDGREKVKRVTREEEEDDQAVPGPAAGAGPGAGPCPALVHEHFRGVAALQAIQAQRRQFQRQASLQEQIGAMHRQMSQQGATLPSHSLSAIGSLRDAASPVQSHMAPQVLYSQPPVDRAGVDVVARSMARVNNTQVVNPEADPRAIQLARIQLNRLDNDIANCNEQLAILNRMKELRERRRQLTIGAPRVISPSYPSSS